MDSLNGNGLLATYGVKILKGWDEFLKYPKRKVSTLSYDWPEENGIQVDRSAPRFADREIQLVCFMTGTSYEDFHTKKAAFWDELKKPNLQDLYLDAFQETFTIAYDDCPSFSALTRLTGGSVSAQFTITVILPTAAIMPTETIIDGNG